VHIHWANARRRCNAQPLCNTDCVSNSRYGSSTMSAKLLSCIHKLLCVFYITFVKEVVLPRYISKSKVMKLTHCVRTVPCFSALVYVCVYSEIYGEFEFRKYKSELLCIRLVMSSQSDKSKASYVLCILMFPLCRFIDDYRICHRAYRTPV